MKTFKRCPAEVEQVAEAYCMGMLPLPEATAFEDHCATCNHCATVVEDTDSYIRAMQNSGSKLRASDQKAESGLGTGTIIYK